LDFEASRIKDGFRVGGAHDKLGRFRDTHGDRDGRPSVRSFPEVLGENIIFQILCQVEKSLPDFF